MRHRPYTKKRVLKVLELTRQLIQDEDKRFICHAITEANHRLRLLHPVDESQLRGLVITAIHPYSLFQNKLAELNGNWHYSPQQERAARIRWMDQWIAALKASQAFR